jgi:hypothetical protein
MEEIENEFWNVTDEKCYELVIVGDENDADHVTAITAVSKRQLELLQPVFDAIVEYTSKEGNKWKHNWPTSEYTDATPDDLYPQLMSNQIEMFNEVAPWGESGIHTVESIRYYQIPLKTEVLDIDKIRWKE